MVVLEHDHLAQIQPVRGGPADQQPVLLHDAKARRRLARAGHQTVPTQALGPLDRRTALGGDAAASAQRAQGRPLPAEDLVAGTGDGGHQHLLIAAIGGDSASLVAGDGGPLDLTSDRLEHGVEEGLAGEDARGFHPQLGRGGGGADDEAADVEGGHVVVDPGPDGGGEGRLRQEGRIVGRVVVPPSWQLLLVGFGGSIALLGSPGLAMVVVVALVPPARSLGRRLVLCCVGGRITLSSSSCSRSSIGS